VTELFEFSSLRYFHVWGSNGRWSWLNYPSAFQFTLNVPYCIVLYRSKWSTVMTVFLWMWSSWSKTVWSFVDDDIYVGCDCAGRASATCSTRVNCFDHHTTDVVHRAWADAYSSRIIKCTCFYQETVIPHFVFACHHRIFHVITVKTIWLHILFINMSKYQQNHCFSCLFHVTNSIRVKRAQQAGNSQLWPTQ